LSGRTDCSQVFAPPYMLNTAARQRPAHPGLFSAHELADVANFFRTNPRYSTTPLLDLKSYARELGIGKLLVKDESKRFGLISFKILGVSYAVRQLRAKGGLTNGSVLACATDGNHGQAVAHVARHLKLPVKVYMPKGARRARVEAIEREGAEVRIVEGNYDEALNQMAEDANANGWMVLADSAWPGYEEIPHQVMAGYTMLMAEAAEQWEIPPDIVLIQAGCGGLACSVLSWLLHTFRSDRPMVVSCEPSNAACVLESMRAGSRVSVEGSLATVMAGLSCGEVSATAWPVLESGLDASIAITDEECAIALRRLARPGPVDPAITAGEAGAAGIAALSALIRNPVLAPIRDALRLGPESTVLTINTEGATDPESYYSITGVRPD
jgi:diaminopropionate ammonia-lyase